MRPIAGWLLSGIVLVAAWDDLRSGRISNQLIVAGLLAGFLCQVVQYKAAWNCIISGWKPVTASFAWGVVLFSDAWGRGY